jgi:hypothetical protein
LISIYFVSGAVKLDKHNKAISKIVITKVQDKSSDLLTLYAATNVPETVRIDFVNPDKKPRPFVHGWFLPPPDDYSLNLSETLIAGSIMASEALQDITLTCSHLKWGPVGAANLHALPLQREALFAMRVDSGCGLLPLRFGEPRNSRSLPLRECHRQAVAPDSRYPMPSRRHRRMLWRVCVAASLGLHSAGSTVPNLRRPVIDGRTHGRTQTRRQR